MKIYISGKITGKDYEKAKEQFQKAEDVLTFQGYEVINPIKYNDTSMTWNECMRNCISLLMLCDAIYMLEGWRESRGARLEHFIALHLKMRIIKQK